MTLGHSIPEQPPDRGPWRVAILLALAMWGVLGVAFVVVSYLRGV